MSRVLIGLSLFAAWASLGRILRVDGVPYPHGLSAIVDLSFLTRTPAAVVATLVYAAAVVAFLRGSRGAAAIVVTLLALGTHLQECQWPGDAGVNGSPILPGAAVAAWAIAGSAEAACGIVGAVYLLAGTSKILASGLAWAGGANLAIHIVSHAYEGLPALLPFRLAIADSPALCSAFGVATLILECGAVVFVVPAARKPMAVVLSAMHIGIGLLMGLHHYEFVFLVLGLAWYRAAPQSQS